MELRRTPLQDSVLLHLDFYWEYEDLGLPWVSTRPRETWHRLSRTIKWRLMDMCPGSWRREMLHEDGDFGTCQRDWRIICEAVKLGGFWLVTWRGAWEVLHFLGNPGLPAEALWASQRVGSCKWWSAPLALTAGSFIKALPGPAPVCSLTVLESCVTITKMILYGTYMLIFKKFVLNIIFSHFFVIYIHIKS